MITTIYILLALAGLLIAAAAIVAFRRSRTAIILLAAALVCAIAGGILAFHQIEGKVGPMALARIRHAAARDPGTDAVAQGALEDNAISAGEYGVIRDTYMHDTGRELNKEPTR